MKTSQFSLRIAATAFLFCGAVALGACSNNPDRVGPAQADHGPMGSTATPSEADVPSSNSQSTPIMKTQ